MENYTKFRTVLLTGAIAAVISLSGYIWSGHVNAEAAQMKEIRQELKDLREVVIRLDAYIAQQQELNEWFVSEHRRRNSAADR